MADRALIDKVLGSGGPDDDPGLARVLADSALEQGDLELAAAALDRAFGLDPDNLGVAESLVIVLDKLAVVELGLKFRHVPAGTFLMGSESGDVDERPVRPVRIAGLWLTDVPVTWADFDRLWGERPDASFQDHLQNKIRWRYCDSNRDADGESQGEHPPAFDVKPLVAVSHEDVERLAAKLSTSEVRYGLPSEAEWERAARGGLIGMPYSWGDDPPDPSRCDFGHFGTFVIRPPRELPPNAYGLYGMCGGVWEWTSDVYDALAYHPRRPPAPAGPRFRVLRGGSFADAAEAVTVSFRMTSEGRDWQRNVAVDNSTTPNIGFRLARWKVKRPAWEGARDSSL